MRISEYNVIGSSVRLDEIPPTYRKLKFLGRGATTLAFERDAQTVIIFTRDAMKLDWLRDGIRMVQDYQTINPVKGHHIRGMTQLPLYMVTMPKLYSLDTANRRKVTDEMRKFTDITKSIGLGPNKTWSEKLAKVVDAYYESHPDSVVLPLMEWLMNYDPEQFYMDMGARQFKQTASGDLVLLDPIVSKELLDLLTKKYKY
jgi:hypothetical protein